MNLYENDTVVILIPSVIKDVAQLQHPLVMITQIQEPRLSQRNLISWHNFIIYANQGYHLLLLISLLLPQALALALEVNRPLGSFVTFFSLLHGLDLIT
jgi:hypothetical protein